jgi:hypothetical protein
LLKLLFYYKILQSVVGFVIKFKSQSIHSALTLQNDDLTDSKTPAITIKPKKLQKIEQLKIDSHYLKDPLKDEMKNEEIFLSNDASIVLKYHGSYMQDNRDLRQKGLKS